MNSLFSDEGTGLFLEAVFSFGVFFAILKLDLAAVSFLETTFFLSVCGVDSIFKAIFYEGSLSFVVISKSILADLMPFVQFENCSQSFNLLIMC
jgi:hypothetical protein